MRRVTKLAKLRHAVQGRVAISRIVAASVATISVAGLAHAAEPESGASIQGQPGSARADAVQARAAKLAHRRTRKRCRRGAQKHRVRRHHRSAKHNHGRVGSARLTHLHKHDRTRKHRNKHKHKHCLGAHKKVSGQEQARGTAVGTTTAAAAGIADVAPSAAPPWPTASFVYSPDPATVGQRVVLDATSSTCPYGPCTYAWSDDGFGVSPVPQSWPIGTDPTLAIIFTEAGVTSIHLAVTDALGRSATADEQIAVQAAPPSSPPKNTGLPTITGQPVEGSKLEASVGTWTNEPMSYSYQWQDCDGPGEGCTSKKRATSASYKVRSSDVGYAIRVLVTASNAAGSTVVESAETALVTRRGGSMVACFQNPGDDGEETEVIEACDYPGYRNTGPEAGTKLIRDTTEQVVLGPGSGVYRYEGKELIGRLEVEPGATGVVLKNDVITTVGLGCPAAKKPACEGNYSFDSIDNQGKDTVISHVAAGGAERTGENVVSECLRSYGDGLKVEYSRFINCDGIKLDDGGTVEHSYCLDNAEIESSEGPAHYECVSDNCSSEFTSPLVLRHNTLFNPHKQTAVIFVQNTYGACHEVVVEDNFLAGGGKSYSGPEAGSNGPEAVVGNRFAFAECMSGEEKRIEGGNWVCAEQEPWAGHEEQFTPQAPGEAGYFPNGGSYTYASHLIGGARHEGNFRDDNLEELAFSDG
jgi:hypothetical protein